MVLPQERLIARVRQLCAADPRLDAALMYGSFAQGTADEFSDIEFWLFFASDPGPPGEWIARIAPPTHLVLNEFGAQVAFDALAHAQRHLLWMARLAEHRTEHWLTPSRAAESELRTAFPHTHGEVRAAWRVGRALWTQLATPPEALFAELDAALIDDRLPWQPVFRDA